MNKVKVAPSILSADFGKMAEAVAIFKEDDGQTIANASKLKLTPYKNVKVVANLPYYITTPIITKFIDEDFYEPRHVMIYRAMVNLRNNGNLIDVLSVVEELKRLNYSDANNISNYLVEIIDSVPSTASVQLYIDIVEEKAIERRLLHRMQDLSDDILNHKYNLDNKNNIILHFSHFAKKCIICIWQNLCFLVL